MRRLSTLRARFALWTSGLLLAILVVFGAYLYTSLASGLSTAMDGSLVLHASQVVAELEVVNGVPFLAAGFEGEPEIANLRARGVTIRVSDGKGQILYEFGPRRDLPVASETSFATLRDPSSDSSIRVYTSPIVEDQRTIATVQIAESLEDVEDTLQRLLLTLIVSVPLLVVVAGGGGYLLAGRALAPVDRITRTARRISAEGLSERLHLPDTGDEVGRLASTLDEMLGRLDESFQRERQFTADASHELRTPLAAMQAILGVTREKRRSVEEYERALADLAGETDRLRTLTGRLLELAQGDSSTRSRRETMDLSRLLLDVTESLLPLVESKGLAIQCRAPAGLTLMGDRDDLVRLFVNLLDNAIKYTEVGRIEVTAGRDGTGVWVRVADTGMGIPPDQLPHIFDRFYRVDRSRRSGGAGLGLAIARDIAQSHGGTIEVGSEVGEGTVLVVYLPVGGVALAADGVRKVTGGS